MSYFNWYRPADLYRLVCRPALPKDTPDVMELTRTIWEGEDYVPYVWQDWLVDPQGLLAVAEYAGHVIGLIKLTRLDHDQWWLEGLRVHPQYEGRKVASHLHDYMLNFWQRTSSGVIRLATASFRIPVHHLCERSGFSRVGEFTPFVANQIDPSNQVDSNAPFSVVKASEVDQAINYALNSPSFKLSNGLMDLGWQWASPSSSLLAKAIQSEQAYWWHDQAGLLVFNEDFENQITTALIRLIACPFDSLVECLQDYRRLITAKGYDRAGWLAPLHPDLAPILKAAGFQRDWDASIYIYEKSHAISG